MEQETTYIKGFNDGYKLAKYQPELFAKLKDSLSEEVEYERGVLEGGKEHEREQQKEQGRLAELNDLRDSPERSNEQDIER